MQSQEFKNLARELKSNLSRLMEQRSTWESHWQECADFMQPRKAEITQDRARGDKRNLQIFDATAIHALELLASSLQGMLTSSANRWFSLRYKEDQLNDIDEAKEWLEDVTDKMYTAFARSNFQQEIFEAYHDLITFGTACMMIESDEDQILRFSTRHIKELYIQENDKGFIDTVYRRFKIPVHAAVEKFGLENLSLETGKLFKKEPFEKIELVHVARPRTIYNENKLDKKNMPFQSIYFEFSSGHIIDIGGFKELPYVIPRYLKASTEIYGRSPAMNALPDVKVLNKMVETAMKAAAKQVDPPLLVPDDSMLAPIRMSAGSLNYYRAGSRDRIEPLNIGQATSVTLNQENQRRDAINKTFHIDQLMISSQRSMTATEVIQRNEEKMRILGPALSRLQSELLQPMILRVFNIMLRNKLFLVAPEVLSNQEIEIEYVSPLAKAQKTQELSSIMRGIEIFGSLQNVAPVFDYLDIDGLVDHVKDVLGLPAKVMRSRGEVQQIQQQKQAAEIEQAQMQQAQQVAESAGKIAPALKAMGGMNE